MIETKSKMVLDFYCAEKTMCEYSGKMEAFAAKILLIRLHKKRINVRVCTTDRSGQLKTLMKEVNQGRERRKLPPIKHCFDTWHFVKSVTKDLLNAAKLKKCAVLSSWIQSIRNMLWYSFGHCGGSAEQLKEMVLSIPKHLAGIHSFPENQLFKQCLHGTLPTVRDKPWLIEGALPMKKVVLALRGYKDCRLRDLEFMTEFQHTSINEQLNNLHNVYLPKSTSFGHTQAIVRACLTAIDHNYNVDRSAATDKDGEDQYNVVASRDGQIYTAKAVKMPKNTKWRKEILDKVLHAARTGATASTKIPTDDHLKIFGKKLPKPSKSVAVAATKARSRFKDLRD